MFSQGRVPFSSAPNKIAPRVAFEIMAARPGIRLKDARCPVLIVASKEDDIMPVKIARDIAAGASESLFNISAPCHDISLIH